MDTAKWTRRYSARTLQELDVLRSFGRWTDVTLQAVPGGGQFPAHRCVLASASPYFAAMLGNENFSEAGQDTITLHEITEEGLRGLLKFVYSGCIDLTAENIRHILKAASITQVSELMDVCQKALKTWLDCDNVVDIWTYSTDYSLPSLQTAVLEFVGKHLLAGIDRKVFLRFDGVFVERLLRESMITSTESNVLAVIMQWLQFNLRCRQKYARTLLKLIYWDRIHLKDTRAITVRSVRTLRDVMTEASKQPSPPVLRGMVRGVLLIGGFSVDGPLNDMRFLPETEESGRANGAWSVCGRLPTKSRLVDFAACALPDGGVVVCGGTHLEEAGGREVHSNSVFILDAHTNRWVLANPMRNERSLCQSVWFRNFVYVFGGDVSATPTCERYNICTNQWEFLGPIPCQSEGFAVCLAGAKIVLSGEQRMGRPT
ncbi:hypothetical protein RvY_15678-2 [Ramazzottius varieornatus]|uniref:BTB domain-containing protein n=1 Tax=Ramazzottius varieornatus TaxID=947166 RepID=A0A1D1VYX7_RAMVA|nr:hypothetical protein RvY_15678-2 [Ramazzottius varieornatus]